MDLTEPFVDKNNEKSVMLNANLRELPTKLQKELALITEFQATGRCSSGTRNFFDSLLG